MTSNHAVNLLLQKLSAASHLTHRLLGLINNLLTVVLICVMPNVTMKSSSTNKQVTLNLNLNLTIL